MKISSFFLRDAKRIRSFCVQFKTILGSCFLILLLLSGCKSAVDELAQPSSTEAKGLAANNGQLMLNALITEGSTLKSVLPWRMGAAIKANLLTNTTYTSTLIHDFNRISAENAMKFRSLHPKIDEYSWTDADKIVNFAKNNGMRVHGHCLIWAKDSTMPDWLLNYQGDKNAWLGLLRSHITTVVNHFKAFGVVDSWDVVNEAINDYGGLVDCIWLRKIGPEYIAKAFEYAQAADPNLKLFYNDYNQEFNNGKVTKIISMAAEVNATSPLMDGVGFQMHTVERSTVQWFKTGITRIAAAGLLVHVSELDVSVQYGMPDIFIMDAELEAKQAKKYRDIFEAYFTIPKAMQFGITTWGVGDKDSFYNANDPNDDHPLLFDNSYQPKMAYYSVIDAGLQYRPPVGQTITLTGNNGKFMSGASGYGPMWCDRTTATDAEKFLIVDAGGGKVALKSKGKYVSLQVSASAITCNQTAIGANEKFDWLVTGGKVSLKGNNGKYICSKNGSYPMACTSTTIGTQEEFSY